MTISSHSSEVLAGFELSTGEVFALLTYFAILAVGALAFLSCFVAALVNGAQDLRRAGRTRHPYLLVLIPLGCLAGAYAAPDRMMSLALLGLAMCIGYGVLFAAGRSLVRWTAPLAVVSYLFLVAGAR
jgi:hypothetical protein